MRSHPGAHVIPFERKSPRIHETAFVAPGACIVGDVEIGPEASVWYNCVLRGDINRIVLGARSNLQDGTIVHVEGPGARDAGWPTLIGEDVLIGHGAILHGCVVEDRAFVGMGATVMNGCRIASRGMLAAGALLPAAKVLPKGQLWVGAPARFLRALGDAELAELSEGAAHYVDMGRRHRGAVKVARQRQRAVTRPPLPA